MNLTPKQYLERLRERIYYSRLGYSEFTGMYVSTLEDVNGLVDIRFMFWFVDTKKGKVVKEIDTRSYLYLRTLKRVVK